MQSHLDDALGRYKTGLAELKTADQFSHEQVLNVFLARDEIQNAIARNNSINGEINAVTLMMVFSLDKTLKEMVDAIQVAVDLKSWRSSYHPKEEAWWWFLDEIQEKGAKSAIARYEVAIESLENADSKTIQQDVERWIIGVLAEVFTIRDAVQAEIGDEKVSLDDLARIANLDERLRQRIAQLPQMLDSKVLRSLIDRFDELRDVLNPSDAAWWWFLKMPAHWWDRYDSIWTVLTVFWLTGTFGLLTDISTRFLGGGGLGTFGAIAIIFQSILALMGGGAITQKGQAIVNSTLIRWKVPKRLWQEVKFGAATVLLLMFVGFRLSLPTIAVRYNNSALKDIVAGNLDGAESKLKRALELNPTYTRAHYNLAGVYEYLGKIKEAKIQYNLAVAGGFVPAYNNQARLYILSKDYANAVNLLTRGIALAKSNDTDKSPRNDTDPVVEHDLWKNLGWARFKQGYPADAKESLKTAIVIADRHDDLEQEAAPHCLLAQTYEELGKQADTKVAWQACLSYARNPNNPEEDEWQQMARKRLHPPKSN